MGEAPASAGCRSKVAQAMQCSKVDFSPRLVCAFGVCWGLVFGREIGLPTPTAYVPRFQVGSLSTWYARACDCGMYSAVRYWRTSAGILFAYPRCWSSDAVRMRSSIVARSTPAIGLESVILRLDKDMRLYDIDVLEDRAEAGDDDRGVETSELEVLYE